MHGVVEEAVLRRVDVCDRATTNHIRHTIGEQRTTNHQHTRCARTADELVRAEHDRILVGQRVLGAPRIHVDVDVG
ncbi:MAG: hypothetical protein LH616_09335, partial [Ilumatobacteraceae bacterium]|nr:hypothetical protein [Ilumatobacteraceae bacterium]